MHIVDDERVFTVSLRESADVIRSGPAPRVVIDSSESKRGLAKPIEPLPSENLQFPTDADTTAESGHWPSWGTSHSAVGESHDTARHDDKASGRCRLPSGT